MALAWACRVTEENKQAIASESGKLWDEIFFKQWLTEHPDGWFLRDPESSLDCHYFAESVFAEMYQFEAGDVNALFRHVKSKR